MSELAPIAIPNIITSLKSIPAVHSAGLVCAVCYVIWSWCSQYYGQILLWQFLGPAFVAAAAIALAWLSLYKQEKQQQRCPTVGQVWAWAIVLRLIAFSGYPILEDDIFRYLWDGYQTLSTGSPYRQVPAAYFGDDSLSPQLESLLDAINYPDVPTIYGPVTQYGFAFAAAIAVAEIWPLQLLMLVVDLCVIKLLLSRASTLYVWLYAVNPLVIKETVLTVHPDMLAILFLVVAVTRNYQQWFYIALACALAVAAKIFAILLVPFCLGLRWRAWLTFIVALIALYLPFINDLSQLLASVGAMNQWWLFNAPLYILVNDTWPQFLPYLKPLLLCGFVVFWAYLFIRFYELKQWCCQPRLPLSAIKADWIYFVFLLAVPVANPWYFLWLLPFAALRGSLWPWGVSVAVMLSYCIGLNLNDPSLGNYQIPTAILFIEYGVIGGLVVACYKKRRK